MRVLVTGGCGLVGYHTAKYYLNEGYEVDVMDNFERSSLLGHEISQTRKYFNYELLKKQGLAEFYPWDVSKADHWREVRGHDLVVHLAGQCGVPTSIQNPRRDFEVNADGTFNALEHARKHGAALVYASTNKVYPIHHGFVKVDGKWQFEDKYHSKHGFPVLNTLAGARTPYGTSKYVGDLLCQEYAHTYGLRTGVFRMSCIYGPNQFGFEEQGWATWFLIAAMKQLPITIYGDGDQTRDMLYVEDLVRAYDSFAQSSIHNGVWNVGGGPNNVLSLNEHLDFLRAHTPFRSEVQYGDWRPLDQKSYVTDIRPAFNDLHWAPTVNPHQGLIRTLHWVENNLEVFL